MQPLEIKLAVLAVFLLVHGIASRRKWYYRFPRIDMATHFLGGLALGAFLKDFEVAIALMVAWEALETLLVREKRQVFRENPLNKASDLFFDVVGYFIGIEML